MNSPRLLHRPAALCIAILCATPVLAAKRDTAAPDRASAAAPAAILPNPPRCDLEPHPTKAKSLWGYKDRSGKVVIPPRYQMAWRFEFAGGGLGAVRDKGDGVRNGWSAIDCKGRLTRLGEDENGFLWHFHDGLAKKAARGKIGYVNLAGEFVIAPQFDQAGDFCRGIAPVMTYCEGQGYAECKDERYIDTQGRTVPTPDPLPKEGRCDVSETTEIVDALPPCDWQPFSAITPEDTGDHKAGSLLWGYKDGTGAVMIRPRFRHAGAFGPDGLAAWGDYREAGYLDCTGRRFTVVATLASQEAARLSPQTPKTSDEDYNYADPQESPWLPEPFREGLVRYEGTAGGMGYRNRRGQIVIPPPADYASPFCDGVAKVGDVSSRVGGAPPEEIEFSHFHFINRRGETVPAPARWKGCGGENF